MIFYQSNHRFRSPRILYPKIHIEFQSILLFVLRSNGAAFEEFKRSNVRVRSMEKKKI